MPGSARPPGHSSSITRRDFLDGLAVTAGALVAAAGRLEAKPAGPYPPALTGLRGSHAGSFETLHRLRDPQFWKEARAPERTRESYDLVVVGAGISGLAAAWQFRKERPGARILVLDNHDDFGGHAKRNELAGAGVTRIGYGGSQSISSPAPYSKAAKALIAELGIPMARQARYIDWSIYRGRGLSQAFFFDRETFGADRLVPHVGRPELDPGFVAGAALSDHARRELIRLTTERFDPWPGASEAEKRQRLARLSYRDFLLGSWKIDPSIVPLFQTRPHSLYGVGIDAVPAQDAAGLGLPGLQGLGLSEKPGPGQNLDSIRHEDAADYFFHFPDGNATIARLLVRRLIPAALPGRSFESAITARADYTALDRPGSRTRIRLSASVVRVRHVGEARAARRVEVIYSQAGTLKAVSARRVILACWHNVIPFICPELPQAQRDALGYGVKVPVVYTGVLIRNWQAFVKLGVNRISAPAFWHTSFALDFPVSVGAYRFPRSPDEPIVLRLTKAACRPGLAARDQHRAGRQELLETPFETIERSIRAELDRMLSPGGFDAARDILAITVNRWPHGYSYQYNSLYDPFWLEGGTTPAEIARRPLGRISIANADAGAYAYADGAIDQGLRAAREALTALSAQAG
jgi:spermidine dehydrogenase